MPHANRKDDQRARLLRAMTEVVAREGYAQASIAQAISLAGVSRSTFYENFRDKLDCFVAVQRDLGARAFARIERTARASPAEDVAQTVLRTLVELAERDLIGARVVLTESLAAGPPGMDERDRLVGRVERVVEQAWAQAPGRAGGPDVPACVLVGGACRLLSVRILRGGSGTKGLLPDLLSWAGSYSRTTGAPRWRTLEHKLGTPLPRSPHAEMPSAAPPGRLPTGRHKLPAAYVSANQRERIIHAMTTTLLRKGYAATTVADIVTEAQLTRAVFYQHFHDKREVLSEINQIHFQQLMAVSARGFFSEERWPDRVWEGIHAAAEMNADHPAATHIGFIDTNAVGSEFAKRINDLSMAFAIFLEQGYRCRPAAEDLPRMCSDAIIAALGELIYREVRRGRAQRFRDLVPHVAYVALAPFMGAENADSFIRAKLRSVATPPLRRGARSRSR